MIKMNKEQVVIDYNKLGQEIKDLKDSIANNEKLLTEKTKQWEDNKQFVDISILQGKNKSDLQKMYNITNEQANILFVSLYNKRLRFWLADEHMEVINEVKKNATTSKKKMGTNIK